MCAVGTSEFKGRWVRGSHLASPSLFGRCLFRVVSRVLVMPRPSVLGLLGGLLLAAACDPVGGENGRGEATPEMARPRVSPVAILAPKIDRSVTTRTEIRDP